MLVTSIFFFSHNVFKSFFFKVVKIQDCVVKSSEFIINYNKPNVFVVPVLAYAL